MQTSSNTAAPGHPGMLAAAGVLPADRGPDVMDGADIAVWVGRPGQPGTGLSKIVGPRGHPDTAGSDPSLLSDGAHPIENIGSPEILPSLIVTHAAPVMVVQRQAAAAALAADKVRHASVDPNTRRCARYRPRTGLDMSTEHPGADAGQVLRIRCVSIQTIHDSLLQIIFAGWDQFRIAGHLSPNRMTVSILQNIGTVTKNHGPYHGKEMKLGGILREIATNGVQSLING